MENKKKNLAERFRLKPKFPNLKKPAKKPLAKLGRNLANRRSISVPDLTMVPGEASTEDASLSSAAFVISPGLSDTDSIASSEFADKLSDPIPETRTRFLQPDHSNPALYRLSTPPGTMGIYEEMDDFGLENKTNPVVDELYAKIDKKGKGALSKFPFEPAPTGKKMSNSGQDPIPRPDLPERSEEVSEKGSRESLAAAALFRAQSMGEQINHYREKQNSSVEPKKTSSEKGTPPTKRQNARIDRLMLDSMGRPSESGDGNSLNSACGTPSEEKANMPWVRDVEEQDREPPSPLPINEFIDENLLDETPADEEDEEEVSIIFIIIYFGTCIVSGS